ncbi:MAG: STT3 domain-containing protein [Desulfovibrionaceae bacterium]|nr:STT3 domain-containing protein [Desulfovibrionaceae bacterium]
MRKPALHLPGSLAGLPESPLLPSVGRGVFWILVTVALAFGLRMLEWPCWEDPEFRLGEEWLLATHDAYHWVAGAEGFSFGAGHPMSELLRVMAAALGTYPAAVAFWFPPVLASLVAGIVTAWGWALGSLEAGVAAGLITSLAPGFLARTLLGFYDTDLVTLFFPLFMTLAPMCWVMVYMLAPVHLLRRLAAWPRVAFLRRHFGEPAAPPRLGNPLRWQWVVVLGASGLISWWTQEWHSVFPYLIRYNAALLLILCLALGPSGRRSLLLAGALSYALPALAGPPGLAMNLILLLVVGRKPHWRRFLTDWRVLAALWLVVGWLILRGGIFETVAAHVAAYLKQAAPAAPAAGGLAYPPLAQSIIEVQDLPLSAMLSYFHPWMEASLAGLLGFLVLLYLRPGALFLLPLAALGLLSTRLGGRMVMFGAPVVALGLALPLFWLFRRVLAERFRPAAGIVASLLLTLTLIVPFTDLVPAMSNGPMINRRHAEALSHLREMAPKDAMVWQWWDWGYAEHHFGGRPAIADGAQHSGPSLYLPAAVFATDNPRFARQLIRYTSECGNVPGNVFAGLDAEGAQALMDRLRSPGTPLVKGAGRQFVVVSYEMLRLGFWISHYGSWNFATRSAEAGALSIVTQALAYQLENGLVQLEGATSSIAPASINVFEETGLTCRNYVQEWFESHRGASREERQEFLNTRRNVNFFFNRVTGEKLAMDARLYNSLMAQLLLADPQDPRFSPYFKLVYDNVFARVYEVR